MLVQTDVKEIKGLQTEREVNLGRHRAQCSICKHPNCKEIEDAWLDWCSPVKIEYDFRVSRDSLYRHCHAFGLFSKRRRNIIRAYERITDRLDTVDYSGSTVVSALGVLLKLVNDEKAAEGVPSAEQQKATVQQVPAKEGESSTADTSLPESDAETPGAEPGQGQDEEKEPQCPEPPTTTVQQVPAKEAENSTADTSLPESGTETPDQEPGQGQDEEKEPQCPKPPTTTVQ